jgi:CxxC-x17-CxxC domain-containing protein
MDRRRSNSYDRRSPRGGGGKFQGHRDRGESSGFRSYNNNNRFGGGYNDRPQTPREMHKATCSDCGAECEVPFVPTEGKPVYCRNCFQNHRKPQY